MSASKKTEERICIYRRVLKGKTVWHAMHVLPGSRKANSILSRDTPAEARAAGEAWLALPAEERTKSESAIPQFHAMTRPRGERWLVVGRAGKQSGIHVGSFGTPQAAEDARAQFKVDGTIPRNIPRKTRKATALKSCCRQSVPESKPVEKFTLIEDSARRVRVEHGDCYEDIVASANLKARQITGVIA